MKELMACMLAIFLSAGIVWGQDVFQIQVKRIFPSTILKSIKMDKGKGEIVFKDHQDSSYFRTGYKINKIFAIESARLFRDVPDLNTLEMTIPLKEGIYTMSISRKTINKFYGLNFSAMKDDLNAWRNKFIQQYYSKRSRAKFVSMFVTSKRI